MNQICKVPLFLNTPRPTVSTPSSWLSSCKTWRITQKSIIFHLLRTQTLILISSRTAYVKFVPAITWIMFALFGLLSKFSLKCPSLVHNFQVLNRVRLLKRWISGIHSSTHLKVYHFPGITPDPMDKKMHVRLQPTLWRSKLFITPLLFHNPCTAILFHCLLSLDATLCMWRGC